MKLKRVEQSAEAGYPTANDYSAERRRFVKKAMLALTALAAGGAGLYKYLLEDCTSPVVVPGVVDYSEQADAAFQRFADAGMHVVKSSQPIQSWPNVPGEA